MPSTAINKRRPLQKKPLPNGTKSSAGKVRDESGGVTEEMIQVIRNLGKRGVDESRTKVTHGGEAPDVRPSNGIKEVVEISSSDEEDEEDEDEEGGEGRLDGSQDEDLRSDSGSDGSEAEEARTGQRRGSAQDLEMVDAGSPSNVNPDEQPEEPTFGELIRGNDTEPIDVEAAFGESQPQSLIPSDGVKRIQPPSATSLGTVLTQSLKTNDTNLLESCLHTTDLGTIRSTIERLDSPLAAVLLQKLAERLHRRPGRAGSLMVWVQWTLVSHGGYLAAQPELMKKLGSLNRVIRERASGLQPLLSLKGKLDMLEAQMQLRRSMQASARTANSGLRDFENDEDGVLYVEGQEESDSDGDNQPTLQIESSVPGVKRSRKATEDVASESEDDGVEMPTTVNGVDHQSDDHNVSSDDDDEMIDDEAEETENDSDDMSEDEVDHEDVDSANEEDEFDDAGPPTNLAR